MSGPPPSRLIFLSDLKRMAEGEKARFLGCVESYHVPTATLILTHAYPIKPSDVAHVNIGHVLESARSRELDTGAWVHVIGYVGRSSTRPSSETRVGKTADVVHVQAIVLWYAGSIILDKYEKAVEARKMVDDDFRRREWTS